jgi:uncharacterized membrane protein YozB (DUF420 family)
MKDQMKHENNFFFLFAITLFAVVLLGFSPSLFLRIAFDSPPIPLYLHLHGVILTGWFVLLIVQAWLIRANNRKLHKKLGYFTAAYGFVVLVGSLMATFNVVSRDLGNGIMFDTDMAAIDPALGSGISYLNFISEVVWINIVSVTTFTVLFGAAIVLRANSAAHKRLILVATVSILGPALARISRLEFLGGEQGPFIPLAILTLLATIVIFDFVTLRKVHKTSLAAIFIAISLFIAGIMISGSEFGQEFVRAMA